ncbi:hypothetical protein DSTSK_33150 [Desulforhabdus sp. TSK]|nr:hypothetical protein DSTSK_33150 [Desulforhabdus sp. TSK]
MEGYFSESACFMGGEDGLPQAKPGKMVIIPTGFAL